MNVLLLAASLASCLTLSRNEINRDNLLYFELHAFTESEFYRDSSTQDEDIPRFTFSGHAYVIVENLMNYSFYVGNYYLAPYETISIGLWGPGSSSGINDHNGVFYNLERYRFGVYEEPQDDIHLSCYVNTTSLSSISSKIIQMRDTYNLLTYNCSSFACELWNLASGESLTAGWINTPYYLRTNMIYDSGYSYSTYYYIGNSSSFCYFDSATSQMIYCY